ncbi:MAG: ATP-binding cassette domain-containing protein [Planctomycetes bacterium]|nr:ATP-binding cassette domain-containing protein [Planctomycetota bacterium]
MTDALELSNVVKRFGAFTAVDGVSLAVPAGAVYGFLGPNGAGKTTTLRMIMDILKPTSGAVRLFGREHGGDLKDRIGYLPEERGLYKKMKVGETLTYFARLKGLRGDLRGHVSRWLGEFQLTAWANHRVEALSKGMAQKVQFIATVIHDPDLLILDEPFSGLDPVNTDLLIEIILGRKARGKTVIFSTHVMEQAEKICEYIVLINRGRVVVDGPLAEVKRAHGEGAFYVEFEGPPGALEGLEFVESTAPRGAGVVVRLSPPEADQALLRALLERGRVARFERFTPALHDIFISLVTETVDHHAEDGVDRLA